MLNFRWLINRLKCMSIEEVLFRAVKNTRIMHESYKLKRLSGIPLQKPEIVATDNWISNFNFSKKQQQYLTAANNILKGRLSVFQRNVDSFSVIRVLEQRSQHRNARPYGYSEKGWTIAIRH